MTAKTNPVPGSAAWRMAVAADVAARYGCAVKPSVVQRVAPGATALPIVWNGTRLVYDIDVNPMRAAIDANYSNRTKRARASDACTAAVRDRRARLQQLHAAGLTDAELMAELQVSLATVRLDRHRLGLRSNFAAKRQNANMDRAASVLDMLRRGVAVAEICKAHNLTEYTVRRTAREQLGLFSPRSGGALVARGSLAQRAAMRRDKISQMVAAGASLAAVLHHTGADRRTVLRDAEELGLTFASLEWLPGEKPPLRATTAARRVEVAELLRQGLSVYAIARRLSCSHTTVGVDRDALVTQGFDLTPRQPAALPDDMRWAA